MRKHFNTLSLVGSVFNIAARPVTPTEHASATFRLRRIDGAHKLSLDLWVGFGNGEKHAGDATPSADARESVPASDPTRSGRATRDGWQPVAHINTDARYASFVTRSVNDVRFVCHAAAMFAEQGYTVEGLPALSLQGAIVRPTSLSRTGVPHNPATFRNTESNTATHRQRARERGNALMAFGRRNAKKGG